jgi:hypothetical protein
MNRVAVNTSNQIVSVGWEDGVLEVEFKGGAVYVYTNVTEDMYRDMVSAESVGGWFARTIKKDPVKYPYALKDGGANEPAKWGEQPQVGQSKIKAVATEEVAKRASGYVEKARKCVVTNNEQYMSAAEFLKGVKSLQNEIAAAFDPIISKAHEAHKEALAQKAKANQPLLEAEKIVKDHITHYLQAEEQRQAYEKARLEKQLADSIRAQAEEQNIKRAQELAEAGDMDGAAAAVDAEVEVPYVPVHVESRVVQMPGISKRKNYKVDDVNLIVLLRAIVDGKAPIECVEANMTFLNQQARSFKKVGEIYPGVTVRTEDSIASRNE